MQVTTPPQCATGNKRVWDQTAAPIFALMKWPLTIWSPKRVGRRQQREKKIRWRTTSLEWKKRSREFISAAVGKRTSNLAMVVNELVNWPFSGWHEAQPSNYLRVGLCHIFWSWSRPFPTSNGNEMKLVSLFREKYPFRLFSILFFS